MKTIRNWFPPPNLARELMVFFVFNAVLSLIVFGYLALLPGDGGVLLGFSAARLILLMMQLGYFCLNLILAINCCNKGWFYWKVKKYLANEGGTVTLLVGISIVIMGVTAMVIFNSLLTGTSEYRYHAYNERLLPVLVLLFVTLAGCLIIIFRHDARLKYYQIPIDHRRFWVWLAIWIALAGIWIFAWVTGIGLLPDEIGWEAPTVPVLEWQILAAWLAAGAFLAIRASRLKARTESAHVDLIIMFCLWFCAVAIWATQPVPDGFFAIRRAPNFDVYPFSDGQFYDIFAQNLLVGNGFKGNEIPPRPLYILMLAGFHFLGGQDYSAVIFLQTLVLAFLPVGLYLIGRDLHNRAAGILIGGIAIFREFTAIVATPFTDNISNSKLFFADLPTALIIVWMVWVMIRWLKCSEVKPWLGMLAGGLFGLSLLFRTQTIFFIPILFLVILLSIKGWRRLFRQSFLFLCGLLLTIAPWLLRSHTITGQFVFDDAESQTRVMALRYLPTHVSPNQLPGESLADYNDRLFRIIIDTTLENPGYVAKFIVGHWINSEIGNLLVLPVRDGLTSMRELWLPTYAFWQAWDGENHPRQSLLMLLNLTIISLGIVAAYRKVGAIGFMPLAINFSYNLSNAIARNSGLRYLLPTDWVGYTYYAIGIMEITLFLIHLVGKSDLFHDELEEQIPCGKSSDGYRRILLPVVIGILFSTIGLSLIVVDNLIPPSYRKTEGETTLNELFSSKKAQEIGITKASISDLVSDSDFRFTWGTGLYPIYYEAGEGEARTAKNGYAPDDNARLVLILVGTTNTQVILHLAESPGVIPNGAEMVVLGCRKELHTQAAIILYPQTGKMFIDSTLLNGCSR